MWTLPPESACFPPRIDLLFPQNRTCLGLAHVQPSHTSPNSTPRKSCRRGPPTSRQKRPTPSGATSARPTTYRFRGSTLRSGPLLRKPCVAHASLGHVCWLTLLLLLFAAPHPRFHTINARFLTRCSLISCNGRFNIGEPIACFGQSARESTWFHMVQRQHPGADGQGHRLRVPAHAGGSAHR